MRPREEIIGADFAQEFRRGRIDADGFVGRAPHDIEDGRAWGGGEERIAGEVDERRAFDQRVRDVAGFERFVGAAIGEEAAFAVRVDKRDQPPGLMGSIADEMWCDADRLEARCLAFDIGSADAGDEVDLHAERGQPRRLIGCGTARLNGD